MAVLEFIGLAFLGFFVGAYGTVIGAGGGFILVPVLLILYPDYKPEQLTAVSLAVVFANTLSGSFAYARQKRVDYVTGIIFAVAAAPGVIAGSLLVHLIPQRLFSALFGVLLVGLGYLAFRGRHESIRAPVRGRGVLHREVHDPDGRTYVYAYKIWQGVVISLGVGFISSLFGIGGGGIHVTAMIIVLHMPVLYSVATSHFVLMFMSGGSTGIHLIDGTLSGEELLRAVALGVGAIPGAQLGAVISHRLNHRAVLLMLGVAIAVLGVRMLVKAAFSV
ncbi:MAG: sulfite exporter TauE/SafE family protein [Chloroflexota bacterium]